MRIPSTLLAATIAALSVMVAIWTAAPTDNAAAQQPTATTQPTATLPPTAMATETAIPPTSTAVATAAASPTAVIPTATSVATSAALPDLSVVMFAAPDPVLAGGIVTYNITVINSGGTTAGATDLISPLPPGAGLSFLSQGCVLTPPATVSCDVPSLPSGGRAQFTISLIAEGDFPTLMNTAIVDPANAIAESNEANNLANIVSAVLLPNLPPPPPMIPPPVDSILPPVPAPELPPVAPAPLPEPPVAAPAPIPAPVTVVTPQENTRWIRIAAATPALSVDGDPLWVAAPGEWYFVVREEGGWVLAIWEGDTPEMSVWIQLDARVEQLLADRPVPAGEVWLAVSAPTEAFTPSMAIAWVASPGEWYRVVKTDGDWVLAYWEFDPPSSAVWILVDGRVRLARA